MRASMKIRFGMLVVSIIVLCFVFAKAKAAEISLSWDPPTTNTDGTLLTDLAGYKIYYGFLSGDYREIITLGNVETYTVTGLFPNLRYFFVATAYNTSLMESDYSNEVSRVVFQAPPPHIPDRPVLKDISLYSNMNVYSDVMVGGSVYKTMTVRNNSDYQVTILQVNVEGNFKVTASFPKTISAGKTASWRIYFRPTEKGLRQGSISIVTEEAGTLIKVLSGNGK
jgi:hypothetical protein